MTTSHDAHAASPAGFSVQPGPQVQSRHVLPFSFSGTAGEYFRIWIVNAVLTVLTVGIYSAWAKVRTKQYFYRHTRLDGATFDYLARPVAILKGRLLVVAVLALVVASQFLAPRVYPFLGLAMLLATPWVMARSLRFNARNSAYRNIRFGFVAGATESYMAHLIGGLVYVLTCGLGMPYMQWRVSQFAVDGHRFGNLPFRFRSTAGDYFMAFVMAALVTIPLVLVWFGGTLAVTMLAKGGAHPVASMGATLVMIPLVYVLLIVPASYTKAKIANLFWGGIDIGWHRLESTQTFREVLVLQVTNILGVALSLGLAYPWAKVRTVRYQLDNLFLQAQGPLLAEAGRPQAAGGALGDAAADLGEFDLDFG